MIKKILFPTDNSENSKKALDYVIEMAKRFQAEVVIFHSYEFPAPVFIPLGGSSSFNFDDEYKKGVKEAAGKLLEVVKIQFEAEKIPVQSVLKQGDAGPSITNTIENQNCDLVIMGSRGLSETKSFLMGSTSNYVMHHTNKPVMVIH
jgi:nucleotide-binding universal stress UspA family protein